MCPQRQYSDTVALSTSPLGPLPLKHSSFPLSLTLSLSLLPSLCLCHCLPPSPSLSPSLTLSLSLPPSLSLSLSLSLHYAARFVHSLLSTHRDTRTQTDTRKQTDGCILAFVARVCERYEYRCDASAHTHTELCTHSIMQQLCDTLFCCVRIPILFSVNRWK